MSRTQSMTAVSGLSTTSAPTSPAGVKPVDSSVGSGGTGAPEDVDFGAIMELMTSKYTKELIDRHVKAIRRLCRTFANGFLLKHLKPLVELLKLAIERFSEGQDELAPAICDVTRIASMPFVSLVVSDMISYGHHLPVFAKVLIGVLVFAMPPTEETLQNSQDASTRSKYDEKRMMSESIRIEVAHTFACWARFGLDEDSVEVNPNQSLIQAIADAGTPNLRILNQACVMDALATAFRCEESPEAMVISLGAVRDMSLYRPLAQQITKCGLMPHLVHIIRVNLLGSDVLLVATEIIWNVLELDWEGAAQAMGEQEVIEAFRDFMAALLGGGYRFKDKVFRNDMLVLLMYISKRPENRPLFAQTGLMALLLSHAISESHRQTLQETGVLTELISGEEPGGAGLQDGTLDSTLKGGSVPLTNSQEDMEFRMLLWGTVAKCCSDESCAQVAIECQLVPSLLCFLDDREAPREQRQWSQEQRRKIQLEALSALFNLAQCIPDDFMEAQGCEVVLRLLTATRSREIQKKCLHLLRVALRSGPLFAEELGRLGAVGLLVDLFADKENLLSSRQLCASVLAGLCDKHPANCREFRKKDGIEALRQELTYRPDETTENHLFYSLCVVDCVWCAVVGTRKNEMRFLDAGGLFALLDVLEVAPLLLKRLIIGCLADLLQYRKAAKLFIQWNSQVTMKGPIKILLELWQSEQDVACSATADGVLRDSSWPLNPEHSPQNAALEAGQARDGRRRSSLVAEKIKHARSFAKTANSSNLVKVGNEPTFDIARVDGASVELAENPSRPPTPPPADIGERQDCRAKIYSILAKVGFETLEVLSIAQRQQMELARFYPEARELETWVALNHSLGVKGVKPISADKKWIDDAIAERTEQSQQVQFSQQRLADERRNEEMINLHQFYNDIRQRAGLKQTANSSASALPGEAGYPGASTTDIASQLALVGPPDESSEDESS